MNQVKKHITIGNLIVICFIIFASIFIYDLVITAADKNASILSDQVWCSNCQTYHDKQTANAEDNQKLIWCTNCKKYHAPDADN